MFCILWKEKLEKAFLRRCWLLMQFIPKKKKTCRKQLHSWLLESRIHVYQNTRSLNNVLFELPKSDSSAVHKIIAQKWVNVVL